MDDGIDAFEIFRFHITDVAHDLPVGEDIWGERGNAGLEIADVEPACLVPGLACQPCQNGADKALIAG